MDLRPGQLLSHFRIAEKIDEGGMGVVYRARDLHLQRDVALKVLSARHAAREIAEHRFRREALALSRLNHPNIAAVFDFDIHEGMQFLVMEWIPGATLDRMIGDGAMTDQDIIDYGEQIASGLGYAHREGVVHRDLKPRNLRFTEDGRIKILDFGLAKLNEPPGDAGITDTLPGNIVGTVPYMAPEVLNGHAASVSSDLYAVGAILYEMATARRAFPQEDMSALTAAIHSERPTPPRQFTPNLAPELEHVILRALEKKPADRYDSASELRKDLRRISSGEPLFVQPRRLTPRHVFSVAFVVLVAAALLFTVGVSHREPRSERVMKPLVTWPGAEHSAQISPDKQWILFVSGHGGTQSLWLKRLKGGEPRIVNSKEGIVNALWSPDGENIGILVSKSGETSFNTVPAFGGRAGASVALSAELANASLLRWYGAHVYLSLPGDGVWQLDLNTAKAHRIADVGDLENRRGQFDVSPDEDRIVFTERTGRQLTMWLKSLSSGSAERLTNGKDNDSGPRFGGAHGEYLFFASDRSGQIDLWRLALENRSIEQITFSPTVEEMQSVSDDLSVLTFVDKRDEAHLWSFTPATKEHRQLTAESMRDDWPSTANRRLAVQRQKPLMQAGVLTLLNGEIILASSDHAPGLPSWTSVAEGGRPYLSPDGRRVAYLRQSTRYLELRVKDLDTAADWLVTDRLRRPTFYPFPRDWTRRNTAWTDDGTLLYVAVTAAAEDQIASWNEHAPPQTLFSAGSGTMIRELLAEGQTIVFVTEPEPDAGIARVHSLDRSTGRDRILYSMARDFTTSLWVRGRLRRGPLVVLTAISAPEFNNRATVMEIDRADVARTIGAIDHAFVGTSKLDPVSEILYFTGVDKQSVHNIFSFSLANGTVHPITNNTVPGISFAGLEINESGELLYVMQQASEDVWLIQSKS